MILQAGTGNFFFYWLLPLLLMLFKMMKNHISYICFDKSPSHAFLQLDKFCSITNKVRSVAWNCKNFTVRLHKWSWYCSCLLLYLLILAIWIIYIRNYFLILVLFWLENDFPTCQVHWYTEKALFSSFGNCDRWPLVLRRARFAPVDHSVNVLVYCVQSEFGWRNPPY